MKTMTKRLKNKRVHFALFLAIFMSVQGVCPIGVTAGEIDSCIEDSQSEEAVEIHARDEKSEEVNGVLEGAGTQENPYLIGDAGAWNDFCDALEDDSTYGLFAGKYVKLTSDITVNRMLCSGISHPFCGNFDGGNHTITVSFGSETTPSDVSETAPFRHVAGSAVIKDLTIKGVIYSDKINTSGLVGSIVDKEGNKLTLDNCHVDVELHVVDRGGCLIGASPMNAVTVIISNCSVSNHVYVASGTSYGGFIGFAGGDITITGCRNSATFESLSEEAREITGFIGYLRAKNTTAFRISDSVFDGSFIGKDTPNWYGIAGGRANYVYGTFEVKNTIFDPAQLDIKDQNNRLLSSNNKGKTIDGYYYTMDLGDNSGGIKVSTAPAPGNGLYRIINAVNGQKYYAPCSVDVDPYVYKYTQKGQIIDVSYYLMNEKSQALTEDEDYLVEIKNEAGSEVDDIDFPGEYVMSFTGVTDKGYYGTYMKNITVYADPAEKPVITCQPEDLSLTYGYVSGNKISVSANIAEGHTASYQWYKNTASESAGFKKIEDAVSNELVIETGMEAGTQMYYYCEITSTRDDNGLSDSVSSNVVMLNVNKRTVSVNALDQTVLQDGAIDKGVDKAVLSGALDGHRLSAVSFDTTGTDKVTDDGLIIPFNAVIMDGDRDVTSNYEIIYTSGILKVIGLFHETLLTGVKDENGKDIVIDIYYQRNVTYNSLKHVEKGYPKPSPKISADYTVSINSSMDGYATLKFKFKNNKNAVVKNGKDPQYSFSYKANKGVSKSSKAVVKAVNKFLKSKVFKFTIDRADIGKVKVVQFETKNDKVKKFVVQVNGVSVKLSKKDYDIEKNADGTYTITGKNNFCGTLVK